jgi:PAS domain S-box-containing protein
VRSLPPQTAILFTRMFRDGAGRAVISATAVQAIAKVSSVPVYAFTNVNFGTGLVGGSLSDIARLGQRAGELANDILRGSTPLSIPLEVVSNGTPIFDWRALKRWRISEERLPPGSVVRFRPTTFWDQYKWLIIVFVLLCLIEATLIGILLRERRRKHAAQQSLEVRLRLEQLVSELSGNFINLPVDQIKSQIIEALAEVASLLRFDIAAVSLFAGSGPTGCVAHLWKADGVPEIPTTLTERDFPWVAQEIFAGHDVSLRSLDGLPPEAHIDRGTYERYHVRSAHNVPILVRGKTVGALGLCTVWEEREMSRELLQAQRLLGEVFANALARQTAEEALRESENRFRTMADSAPVMIWMSATNKLCEYFNKRWLDFTGRTLEQEVGERWAEGVHRDDLQRCLEIYDKSFDLRQEFTMEYRLRRWDGQYGWILDHGVPRFELDGTFLGYIGSCIDVTERKRTELELQRNREELAHVARLSTMGELTASVAHELNQPLGAILSNTEAAELFLKADPPALDEIRDILEDIRKDDERAGAIIRRMRSLLRKREIVLKPIDINAAVKEILALAGIEAAARKVAINLDLTEGLPLVAADRVHVQQVMMNLVLNGLEAMTAVPENQRKLIVRTRTNVGKAQVAVSDSGPGIPADKLGKLFEPFFTTKPHGIGIGLCIARTIVEAHHGEIWAENNPNGGATFSFTIQVDGVTDEVLKTTDESRGASYDGSNDQLSAHEGNK